MSMQPIDITGGKSVYCFNQQQLDRATAFGIRAAEDHAPHAAHTHRLQGRIRQLGNTHCHVHALLPPDERQR